MADSKRSNGRYFTRGNPFRNAPFKDWTKLAGLPNKRILEPFAGSNSLIDMLVDMDLCKHSSSFDIAPASAGVMMRDTLKDFPKGYDDMRDKPALACKEQRDSAGIALP